MARRRGSNARIQIRRKRRQTPGKFKLKKPKWIDPYPWIPGTEPEKRIFEALVLRRIYFIFQGQVPEFEKGGKFYSLRNPGWKPDFVLPEYKVCLDPFSPFHHSLEAAQRKDQIKIANFEAIGYHYIHPWAFPNGEFVLDQRLFRRWFKKKTVVIEGEVFHNVKTPQLKVIGEKHTDSMGAFEMLGEIPYLQGPPRFKLTNPLDIKAKKEHGYRIGENVGAGATGVGAANSARRKERATRIGFTFR